MSMQQTPPPSGGGLTDVVTQLQGIINQLSAWVKAFTGRMVSGSFTLSSAPTTTIANSSIQAGSILSGLLPLNAAAATLTGSSKSLYLSSISPGVSFTVATADGTNAAGTEKFQYQFTTP